MKAQLECRIPRERWNEVHDALALPPNIIMQFREPVAHEDPNCILIITHNVDKSLIVDALKKIPEEQHIEWVAEDERKEMI